ncbi:TPM domain-containing protein [Vagococcus humatus]|uniref:TPM domain-containing protein n=1 Tax=Vagococcus humatus TaxID=1889241 RepID=A0A429Z9P3_9ENTE|nr:TPM domain-containing protein [Vagococcus humatus]RST90412.1 hypothetical protein C7P63_04870 [Vagococcus humatus]
MKKSIYQKQKLLVIMGLLMTGLLIIIFPNCSVAASSNIFVEDQAHILNDQDKDYIKKINEEKFSTLDGKPQYVVVTLPNLEGYDSIEDYAEQKFQKLGIGQKNLDNGFLFVIAIEDHKYRLETGYGVEDVITDSMKEDIVNDEAVELLKDEQYGAAVMTISQNIERVVLDRYGNYDASKQAVIQEKERKAKAVKLLFTVLAFLVALVVVVFLIYQLRVQKLKGQLQKEYIDKNMKVFIYEKSGAYKQVQLSSYLARQLIRISGSSKLLKDQEEMGNWLGQYLIVDALIQYWRQAKTKAPYSVSIYMDQKHLDPWLTPLLENAQSFEYPLKVNPFTKKNKLTQAVTTYFTEVTEKHELAVRISQRNQTYIHQVCSQFLMQNGIQFRNTLNHQLEIALMTYYFLKGKDLSSPHVLDTITLDDTELNKAFRFAEKKRKEIDSSQKQQALSDLTNMTLGNYYLQSLIWSNYHSSGSSSIGGSGGGSSFGGGSSGGGGFSGGW